MDLFSGTPGLSAVKLLLAGLVRQRRNRVILLLDTTGAFLYGLMRRLVVIRLPPECGAGPDVVGVLYKSLYGLRDAPLIWQQHLGAVLRSLGFQECPTAVGIYKHSTRDIQLAAHVDDVLAVATETDLVRLRRQFEVTV